MPGITQISSDALSSDSHKALSAVIDAVGQSVLGKREQIRMALCCLLARGHLLIEDMPGMGKTTLAHALGDALGLAYQRIQFTSDMLPADVLGASIFDRESGSFRFVEGPVFTQLLLADEVNRTTPKTQSALLEAMEERQVTIDGVSRPLPEPFFVIATQNPGSQSGTYPLPESQLDRFLMRIELGYPDQDAERLMLRQGLAPEHKKVVAKCLAVEQLIALQACVDAVKASDVLLDYLQRLVEYSRSSADFACGLSPRGTLSLLQAAKAWALLDARNHVIPEDIQSVLPAVAAHRLVSINSALSSGLSLVAQMLDAVEVL
ncbi:MAG: MoxR family ATPase [Pseudomonadales bacterium]|nr:MoxR family ATPase [Gammaproteobacteria bacterium]NNL56677.1 MoxR family ATPase [Pseudomonadales bacterium]